LCCGGVLSARRATLRRVAWRLLPQDRCPLKAISRSRIHRALLDLSHQRLDNKVLWRLLDRYRKGKPPPRHDRALVLISGSFIEQGLESVIELATVREYDEQSARDDLFGRERPGAINGFYGKIILGHALGAYTKSFKEDLDRIRHIRNAFAHARGEISFHTQEIADACHFNTTDYFEDISFENARARYVFMAFFVAVTFELLVKDVGDPHNRPPSYPEDQVIP
jgi:hypothetical protein